mmetsp:Transcript_10232/g.17143  ORF Transcript_10232/g.17143 Transcript_10232/m.17143 type:complete len:209 (-) Transcript_10232:931-1557(-)
MRLNQNSFKLSIPESKSRVRELSLTSPSFVLRVCTSGSLIRSLRQASGPRRTTLPTHLLSWWMPIVRRLCSMLTPIIRGLPLKGSSRRRRIHSRVFISTTRAIPESFGGVSWRATALAGPVRLRRRIPICMLRLHLCRRLMLPRMMVLLMLHLHLHLHLLLLLLLLLLSLLTALLCSELVARRVLGQLLRPRWHWLRPEIVVIKRLLS